SLSFSGAGTGRQSSARPDGTFVKMWQELGADRTAEAQIRSQGKHEKRNPESDHPSRQYPLQSLLVARRDPADNRVLPCFYSLTEKQTGQHRRQQYGKDERSQ